jgi:hypothetical protein
VVPIGPGAEPGEGNWSDKLEEDPPGTRTGAEGEKIITHEGVVMSNDYWEELGFPDPAAPPIEDPGRIRLAEDQIKNSYFKWFDGIYRKDPGTLWESVATEGAFEQGVKAMERMTFIAPPTLDRIAVEVLELYVDHPDCLVAAFEMDISGFRNTSGLITKVIIMWPDARYGWRRDMSFGLPTIYGMWWSNCFIKERAEFP